MAPGVRKFAVGLVAALVWWGVPPIASAADPTIQGQLRDADTGSPLGVSVTFYLYPADSCGSGAVGGPRATTDFGSYSWQVPPGSYKILVARFNIISGYINGSVLVDGCGAAETFTVSADETVTRDLDIRLRDELAVVTPHRIRVPGGRPEVGVPISLTYPTFRDAADPGDPPTLIDVTTSLAIGVGEPAQWSYRTGVTSFVPKRSMVGKPLRIGLTAANPDYRQWSSPTVLLGKVRRPSVDATLPQRIRGRFRVGRTLSVRAPEVRTPGARAHYRWKSDGRPIRGATGRTWTARRPQRGTQISITITVSKPGFLSARTTLRGSRVR